MAFGKAIKLESVDAVASVATTRYILPIRLSVRNPFLQKS